MKKTVFAVLSVFLCLTLLSSCTKKSGEYKTSDNAVIELEDRTLRETTDTSMGKKTENTESMKVVFELEHLGKFVMELYPKYAPETVRNFADLVNSGFYDGLIFHRVIPGFMAQGGQGSPDKELEPIKGEFRSNGFSDNTLKHERGVVSMARTPDKDSATSQFFICFEDSPHLDGEYAAFGKVVYGMDAVDKIGEATMDENDKPLVDIVIKKAYIISEAEFEKYKEKTQ